MNKIAETVVEPKLTSTEQAYRDARIMQGLEDVAAGRTMTVAEAKQRMTDRITAKERSE